MWVLRVVEGESKASLEVYMGTPRIQRHVGTLIPPPRHTIP
jgi:hypothetical protein